MLAPVWTGVATHLDYAGNFRELIHDLLAHHPPIQTQSACFVHGLTLLLCAGEGEFAILAQNLLAIVFNALIHQAQDVVAVRAA